MEKTPSTQPVTNFKFWAHTFFATITVLSFYTGVVRASLGTHKHVAPGQSVFTACGYEMMELMFQDVVMDVTIRKSKHVIVTIGSTMILKDLTVAKWEIISKWIGTEHFNVTIHIPNIVKDDEGVYTCSINYKRRNVKFLRTEDMLSLYVQEPAEESKCNDSWIHFGPEKTCLAFFKKKLPWKKARQYCKDKHNADMAVIFTRQFDDFLGSLMQQHYRDSFYIGLRYNKSHKEWTWLNRPKWGFYKNLLKEAVGDLTDKCARKEVTGEAAWIAQSCSLPESFICERKEGVFSSWDTLSMSYAILQVVAALLLISALLCMIISLTPRGIARRLKYFVLRRTDKDKPVVLFYYDSELNEMLDDDSDVENKIGKRPKKASESDDDEESDDDSDYY